MKIKHIYPVADTIVDGDRVTVDVVLVWDGDCVTPKLRISGDERYYLHGDLSWDHPAIRALGFHVGEDQSEVVQTLELAGMERE